MHVRLPEAERLLEAQGEKRDEKAGKRMARLVASLSTYPRNQFLSRTEPSIEHPSGLTIVLCKGSCSILLVPWAGTESLN